MTIESTTQESPTLAHRQSRTITTVPTAAPSFLTALVAGGVAGTAVDVALFPIDTLKTRLQAPVGFIKAGGFRGIYQGLGAAAAGSAPGAALFFSTYEGLKPIVRDWLAYLDLKDQEALGHMTAASVGEAAACLVRVPTDVVKSKMQTAQPELGLFVTIKTVWQERHGGGNPLTQWTGGLYRGYGITLFREIPFAVIRFLSTKSSRYGGPNTKGIQSVQC
ncbi:MAG: MC/SLC25 family protein, partial [Gammaproteobacteria bacterium]